MAIPVWVAALDDGFDPTVLPVIIYCSLRAWLMQNTPAVDVGLLNDGAANSWPRPGPTAGADIHRALVSALADAVPTLNTTTMSHRACLMRLIQRVHPDRFLNGGFRCYYAAMACTALLYRWGDIVEGVVNLPDIRAMPRLLVTPFAPRGARANPPSSFELHAADLASSTAGGG